MEEKKPSTLVKVVMILTVIFCLVVICLMAIPAIQAGDMVETETATTVPTTLTTEPPTTEPTEPPLVWEPGYIAAMMAETALVDEAGSELASLIRGTEIEYTLTPEGTTLVRLGELEGYLPEGTTIAADRESVIPEHTLYVRSAVNLRDAEGRLLEAFGDKGTAVTVTGCDYVDETGAPHMYRVALEGQVGYILPWYLTGTEEAALENYDDGDYATHADRGNRYGGGGAANLDYFPREKAAIEGNPMPEECRTLYIAAWCVGNVDTYLDIANNSGINAFVVDIVDGGSVGYAGAVMQEQCPTAAGAANYSVEDYQAAIQKIKDAGYYVIGRITTFNDSYYVKDHPEQAITDLEGNPLKINAEYWPTAYNRSNWQYKVDLAVEAVELMGFHEIQFDYVRFPDLTWSYEEAGTIDYHNVYGETKAQAIQRFLMYATDILHEKGVYVSADVFGESAYNYVTAYGQYWPAISNVVDAISGMPYPDHFSASGDWRPWEHPYDTLYSWGTSVMYRQNETATPAAVRTWIQAYNAIREPYNTYGPDQVLAQIQGLRDSGCTGGYMTWNSASDVNKYYNLIPAFTPPE